MKLTITVTEFRPFPRNTLRGFATVHIDELKLSISDIAIHQRLNGKRCKRWVSLPPKPLIGEVDSDAFTASVLKELLRFDPLAFDHLAVRP